MRRSYNVASHQTQDISQSRLFLNNFILKRTLPYDMLMAKKKTEKHVVLNHGENNEQRRSKIRFASDIAEIHSETLLNCAENGNYFCPRPVPFNPAIDGEFRSAGAAAAARCGGTRDHFHVGQ
jgi:hypothetical protein